MPTKKIRFDYFRPTQCISPETLVKLTPYFTVLAQMNPEDREIEYYNITSIRINYIKEYQHYHITNGGILPYPLWEVRFTRPRYDIPGKFNNITNETTPVNLDDDEYITDETTLLYDEKEDIVIIQRNRGGASPSAIQKILNGMTEKEEDHIEFQPIIKTDSLQKVLQNEYYTSINIRLTNTNDPEFIKEISNNTSVKKLVDASNEICTPQEYQMKAEFILKIGERNTKNSFIKDKCKNILTTLFPLIKNDKVDRLLIKGKSDSESPFEEVDLIKDVVRDWISFEVSPTNRYIASTVIFDKIAYTYSRNKRQQH